MPVWKTVAYTLLFPVGEVKELTFVEPDGEKLEAIDGLGLPEEEGKNPTIKQVNAMISILSGQPIEVIRKMNNRDIKAASEAMVPLLDGAI